MTATTLRELRFSAFDVPLREPFGIATGAQVVAKNVLIEAELTDGTVGLGEAAPFPVVSGETQAGVLAALPAVAQALAGADVLRYRPACGLARELLHEVPSALAGVETA